MPGLSGVGISFGADRIYDVLNTLDLYPAETGEASKIIFANFGDAEAAASLKIIRRLREAGIAAELYPDNAKMKKQIGYADAMHIPYVGIIGESELEAGTVTLKDLSTGEQRSLTSDELIDLLK